MTSRLVCRVIFIVSVSSSTAIFFLVSKQFAICSLGRTGRAGREGKAVTYFTDEDAPFLKTFVIELHFIPVPSAEHHSPFSIANVLLQSGSSVPDWILKLPKPSKMKRRQMGKVKRLETVNSARKIGRNDAVKKRYAITICLVRIRDIDKRFLSIQGYDHGF